jgi:hypothetical protein
MVQMVTNVNRLRIIASLCLESVDSLAGSSLFALHDIPKSEQPSISQLQNGEPDPIYTILVRYSLE